MKSDKEKNNKMESRTAIRTGREEQKKMHEKKEKMNKREDGAGKERIGGAEEGKEEEQQ